MDFRTAWANRHAPESLRPIAAAFWSALLMVVLAMSIGILACGAYFFYDTLAVIEPPADTPARRVQKVDREQLGKVLSQLVARQDAFEKRALPAVIPPDPSI